MKNKGYFGGKARSGKKIVLTTIIVLLVFIPTIVALISAFLKANYSNTEYLEVSLFYQDELLYSENSDTKENTFDSLVNIFDSILSNISKSSYTPSELDDLTLLKATVIRNGVSNDYSCYFSTDENLNYISDSNGTVYKIDSDSAMKFISSSYSQILYKNATPPNLFSTSGDIILPSSLSWKYKNVSGDIIEANGIVCAEETIEYNMAGSLGLIFSVEPDTCTVNIKKSGTPWEAWRKGSHLNLPLITVESGTTLQFEVTAVWNDSNDRDFFGTVDYNFNVIVRDRAEFNIDKVELQNGDFIVVSCTNIFDTQKLNFYSEPDIGYYPNFFEEGNTVYALIPFSKDLSAGSYKLSFSYGATSKSFDINLSAPKTIDKYYTVKYSNNDLFHNYIDESSLDELGDILRNIDPEYSKYFFCKQEFGDYLQNSATIKFDYGSLFRPLSVDKRFTLEGIIYQLGDENGASVTALNSGTVVSSGSCTFLGNYVIIEHGLGIRTVYGHLAATNVEDGDAVIRGQNIGRTGKLNEFSEEGVLVMCYIYDIPINYSNIAGNKIDFYVYEEHGEE